MIPRECIVLVLDLVDRKRLLDLSDAFAGAVGMFKIGSIAFTALGPETVREVARRGPVFLDLKFHDIPNTVAGAVAAASHLGVHMLTVHAAGGKAMIAAAAEAARGASGPRPRIIAVTMLTHLEPADLPDLGVTRPILDQALALAVMAREAGADGVVCSPHEARALRGELDPEALLVVPGIRPAGADRGDQRRVATPAAALAAGANYLVIGRPILDAPDPVAALEMLRAEV